MKLFQNKQKNTAEILSIVSIIVLFVVSTLFAREYQSELELLVQSDGALGMFLYVLIDIFATVVAPISALPLMPIGVSVWGWVTTALLSIVGWVLGSQIAFYLAQKYGKSFIQKIVSLEKIAKFEKQFSEKDIFWTVVLLRITIPVDILSYALGLFSSMSHTSYFFATLIGVTPFAFVFAYTGSLSPLFQMYTFIGVFLAISLLYIVKNRKKK